MKIDLKVAAPCAVLLIDALAAGVLIPHLPELTDQILAGRPGGGAKVMVLTALFTGQAILGPAAAQFFRVLPWAAVCAIGFSAFAAGMMLLMRADSFALTLIALAFPGLSVSTTIVAISALSRTYPPEERVKGQGVGFALVAIGFILGPAISGLSPDASLQAVLASAVAVCALGLALCGWVLATGSGRVCAQPDKPRRGRSPRLNAELLAAAWCAGLLAASSQPFTMMWPLVGREAFDLSRAGIGLTFAVITALTAFFNIALIPRLEAVSAPRLALMLLVIAGLYLLAGVVRAPALFLPIAFCVALLSCAPALLSGIGLRQLGGEFDRGDVEAVNTIFFYAGAGGAMAGAAGAFFLYDQRITLMGHAINPAFLMSAACVIAALGALAVPGGRPGAGLRRSRQA